MTDGFTIGSEHEFFLYEARTGRPASQARTERLAHRLRDQHGVDWGEELFAHQMEIRTPVCFGFPQWADTVRRLLALCRGVGAAEGLYAHFAGGCRSPALARQRVSAHINQQRQRNHWLADYPVVSGFHVHIGLADLDRRGRLYRALAWATPAAIAWLIANGAASPQRLAAMRRFPRHGHPPESPRGNEIWPGYRTSWYDFHLHPRYDTIELRAFDATTRLSAFFSVVESLARLGEERVGPDEGFARRYATNLTTALTGDLELRIAADDGREFALADLCEALGLGRRPSYSSIRTTTGAPGILASGPLE